MRASKVDINMAIHSRPSSIIIVVLGLLLAHSPVTSADNDEICGAFSSDATTCRQHERDVSGGVCYWDGDSCIYMRGMRRLRSVESNEEICGAFSSRRTTSDACRSCTMQLTPSQ